MYFLFPQPRTLYFWIFPQLTLFFFFFVIWVSVHISPPKIGLPWPSYLMVPLPNITVYYISFTFSLALQLKSSNHVCSLYYLLLCRNVGSVRTAGSSPVLVQCSMKISPSELTMVPVCQILLYLFGSLTSHFLSVIAIHNI